MEGRGKSLSASKSRIFQRRDLGFNPSSSVSLVLPTLGYELCITPR